MEEFKVENTEVVTKFKTSDGIVFDSKDRAELHEQFLVIAKKVKKLKRVDGVYYCETQEDFDSVIDLRAYGCPYYDFCSNSYKPHYGYSKSSFQGADWYFFEMECYDNTANEYWVETLSGKKAKWDEFYKQFQV